MKKILSILVTCAIIFCLSSCKNSNSNSEDTEINTSELTSSTIQTTVNSQQETENEKQPFDEGIYNCTLDSCKLMLDSLVNKDINTLLNFSGHQEYEGPTDMYDFINNIDVDEYVIDYDNFTQSETNEYLYIFPVKLNISKSDNDMFPIGESNWNFSLVTTAFECMVIFERADATPLVHIGLINDNYRYPDAALFCYNLTNYLNESFYDKAQNSKINIFKYNPLYIDSCATPVIRFLQSTGYLNVSEINNPFTVDNIKTGFEKMVGTIECDLTLDKTYKADNDSLDSQIYGAWWSSATLKEETYNKEDNTYTIIIDWWADNMFMVKAKTIKYTILPLENKQFKLISLEYLYDSKYQHEGGSD